MTESTVTIPVGASPEAAASQHVFQLATGYITSTALYAAVTLGIADRLAAGPHPVGELARQTGAAEDALYRVLRLLASLGVFEETGARTFANTLASSLLRTDTPGSLQPLAVWMADPFHLRVYANIMHSVQTGQPAADKAVGMPVFEYFRQNHELSEIFNDAMTAFSAPDGMGNGPWAMGRRLALPSSLAPSPLSHFPIALR